MKAAFCGNVEVHYPHAEAKGFGSTFCSGVNVEGTHLGYCLSFIATDWAKRDMAAALHELTLFRAERTAESVARMRKERDGSSVSEG